MNICLMCFETFPPCHSWLMPQQQVGKSHRWQQKYIFLDILLGISWTFIYFRRRQGMVAQNSSSVENWYLNSLRGQMIPYIMDITPEQVSILKFYISQSHRKFASSPFRQKDIFSNKGLSLMYSKEPSLQHRFNAAINKLSYKVCDK